MHLLVLNSLQVIELQQTIGALVISLIEENGPGASQVAKVRIPRPFRETLSRLNMKGQITSRKERQIIFLSSFHFAWNFPPLYFHTNYFSTVIRKTVSHNCWGRGGGGESDIK